MERKKQHIGRAPICPERIRRINGGFAFMPHRFLRDGFFVSLNHHELLLYVLLVLAADRNGISFYGCDSLCTLLGIQLDQYINARNALIAKDLIAFDGTRFQVLSLPQRPISQTSYALTSEEDFEFHDPATVRRKIQRSLGLIPQGEEE